MAQQGGAINVGSIVADLDIRTGNLDRGLARARQALDAVDQELRQLDSDLDAGAITLTAYTARFMALGRTTAELTTHMNAAYSATTTLHTGLEVYNQTAGRMVSHTARMGQGLMQLGYIADDIQYGFSGIINNVAPLAQSFASAAGVAVPQANAIAAGVQIAAVAAYQLYVNWDRLTEALGVGTTRTEAEEMERLAKATSRTADEQDRLNKYKEKQTEIQRMLAGKSKEQVETEKQVQDIYDEAGVGKLRGILTDRYTPQATPADMEEVNKAREAAKNVPEVYGADSVEAKEAREALAKAEKDLADKLQAEGAALADNLLLEAKRAGKAGQEARTAIMNILRGQGEGGVADQLGGVEASVKDELGKAGNKAKTRAEEKAQREAEKKEREAEADRKLELGPLKFLEEKQTQGKTTKGEDAELARLKAREAERAQGEKDRDREREIGKLPFLQEKIAEGRATPGDKGEAKRMEAEQKEREAREKERAKRESVREAMDQAPGVEQFSEMMAMQVVGGALSEGHAKDRIAKFLKDNGVDATKVVDATDEIYDKSEDSVRKGIAKRMFEGKMSGEDNRTAQVFDSSTLAAQFQNSVGGNNYDQKQLTELELIRRNLDIMARAGVINVRVQKK